jgi:GMP synthase-like glutamine amidotransferase
MLQCWKGELPDLATAASQYRGIFISGSHYSAYAELQWIADLAAWLHAFLTKQQHDTRIVSVCFGSQVPLLA